MNSYEEGRKYLDNIGIDVRKITQETGDYIFQSLNDGSISPDDIKLFAAPQTPPEKILEVLGLDPEYFLGKRVLDLGGGFGGMPFLLENHVEEYVLCDPSFDQNIRDYALNRAFTAQEYFAAGSEGEYEEINKQLKDFNFGQISAQYKYFDLQKRGDVVFNSMIKKKKVLKYIDMWRKFSAQNHPRIITNPSKGENIQGIEDGSQDIVLICHVLDKSYVNYLGIMAEASRILKSNGEILIVEDADDDIRKILVNMGLKWIEKGFKLICKIKKD